MMIYNDFNEKFYFLSTASIFSIKLAICINTKTCKQLISVRLCMSEYLILFPANGLVNIG